MQKKNTHIHEHVTRQVAEFRFARAAAAVKITCAAFYATMVVGWKEEWIGLVAELSYLAYCE